MSLAVIIKVWNEETFISLCLEQFRGIADMIYLFDDGSTDRAVDVALSLNLPMQVITVSEPHAEYFPANARPEAQLLNRMIDTASGHDWVMQIDADEVISNQLRGMLRTFRGVDCHNVAGIYIPYCHLVDSPTKHIVSMPGVDYQLYPDFHMRLFRPTEWRFPDVEGLDAIIQRVNPRSDAWRVSSPILHMHYLDADRRGLRGGTGETEDGSKQASFRQPGCVYGTVPDDCIPASLWNWYNSRSVRW